MKKIISFLLVLVFISSVMVNTVKADIPRQQPGATKDKAVKLNVGKNYDDESAARYFEVISESQYTWWYKFTVTSAEASGAGTYFNVFVKNNSYDSGWYSNCSAYLQKNSDEIIKSETIGYINNSLQFNGKLAAGTYFIRITTKEGRGAFTVNVTKQMDDYPSTLNTARTVSVGKLVSGKTDGYDDYDCFKFQTYSYERFSFELVNASNEWMSVTIRDNAQGLVYSETYWDNVSKTKEFTLRKNSTYYVTFTGYGKNDYICHYYFKVSKIVPKNGLLQDSNGDWYLWRQNEVRTDFTGLYPYGTSLFYLNRGKLDRNFNDVHYYQGKPYLVRNGQVTFTATGLGRYNNSLHYFTNNVKDSSFNGIAYYQGEPYYVQNGIVTFNFTGLGKYNSTWWYVKNSRINKSYTGNYKWKGVVYKIKNGKVVSPKVKY